MVGTGILAVVLVEDFVHHVSGTLEFGFPCVIDSFDLLHPHVEVVYVLDTGTFVGG